MKRVLIAGATGMIGSLVLRDCLERGDVVEVTCLLRRTTGLSHPKLKEAILPDHLHLEAAADVFAQKDIAFYCVGAYTGALPPEEFRKVTVDTTVAFAKALKSGSPQATVCFLSGDGADRTEKSRVQFARDKGAAENFLFACGFPKVYTFRPGYIYPVQKRKEPNMLYRVMRVLYKPLFSWLTPGMAIKSTELVAAMVHVAFNGNNEAEISNNAIRAIAKAGR